MKKRKSGSLFWPVAAFALIGQLLASETSYEATELAVVGGIAEATPIRFVPPPAPEPMPEIPVRVSAAVDKGTHSLTLQRGAPSTLPDIPAPVVKLQAPVPIPELPRIDSFVIGLSVTVYDRSTSHLKWRDPQTGEALEAWCGWDFSLLGPMHELAGEKIRYWLLFSPIHIDSSALTANQRSSIPDRSAPENDDIQFVKGDASVQAGRRLLKGRSDLSEQHFRGNSARLFASCI